MITLNSELRGYSCIFLTGVLWGTIGLFVRLLDSAGSTFAVTSFLRLFFACVIIAVVTVAKFGLNSFRISRRTFILCTMLGIVCHGLCNIFNSLAVVMVGVAVSGVLMSTAPIFTILIAGMFLSERLTLVKIIAIIINIVGCSLTATGGELNMAELSLIGILCGIGSGLCYGMTAIFGKLAGDGHNPFVVSTYSYLIAAVFLFIFMRPWQEPPFINGEIIVLGILFALVPTVFAYILYFEGLKHITETGKVPVIASVEAVVAALIGVFIFSEQVGTISLLGILLVLLSIFLINHKRA